MVSKRFLYASLPTAALLATLVLYTACSDEEEGFRYASPELQITLPQDHAAHADFRNEWWYYTGHLQSVDGREFGFQLTWFRVRLTPEEQNESGFRSNTLYFAHFAVSDIDGNTFHFAEKISRGGDLDDAGADTRTLRTWIEDWRLERLGAHFYLAARTDSIELALIADQEKEAVLQGENGYSRKGASPTNASMYYSIPRLSVAGVLVLKDELLEVKGEAWMDHEYGTSQLSAGQVGWDWFSLQLDNGEEIMLYGLREADGSISPTASGTYVQADGTYRILARDDFSIEVLDQWESPHSGARYPSRWRISIPSADFTGTVTPLIADQELRTENSARVTYWEGAVAVEAEQEGTQVGGRGYVELTGYLTPLNALADS